MKCPSTNDGINCADGSTVCLTRVVNDSTTSNTWTHSVAPNTPGTVTTVTEPQTPYDLTCPVSAGSIIRHSHSVRGFLRPETPGDQAWRWPTIKARKRGARSTVPLFEHSFECVMHLSRQLFSTWYYSFIDKSTLAALP